MKAGLKNHRWDLLWIMGNRKENTLTIVVRFLFGHGVSALGIVPDQISTKLIFVKDYNVLWDILLQI
jgi:hypothetical protein